MLHRIDPFEFPAMRSYSTDVNSGRQGGCCRHWQSLVRFLIVRFGEQGEMRKDAHFRHYDAWMHLSAGP